MEAWEISQIGMKRYLRRKKVKEIISSLLTLEDMEMLPQPGSPGYSTGREIPEESGFICGELEVNRIVRAILYDAVDNGGDLSLLVQPGYGFLMENLMMVDRKRQDMKVTHIICLEKDSGEDGCANLDTIQKILRYGVGIRKYEPRYYYGSSEDHYGIMSVIPCLVLTDRYAIFLSPDRNAAYLHREPDMVSYLQKEFARMVRETRPLMTSIDGIRDNCSQWSRSFVKICDFPHAYEMSSGLCSVQFWDGYLIRKYINKEIPEYEQLAGEYAEYAGMLYEVKKKGQVTVLMNRGFVEEFIKSGVFREYPEIFFSMPVSPDDRRLLVGRILEAVREGWYHIRMVPGEEFCLGYRWEILVYPGSQLVLQYPVRDQFRVFRFEEPGIIEAMYDYLENLAGRDNVLDDSQSCELLERWMEQYL